MAGKKVGLTISDEMYDALVRAKNRRMLYTIPETIRMVLYEKFDEEDRKNNYGSGGSDNNL